MSSVKQADTWDAAPENLLNKNVYQYDYQGNVLESLGGRTYMEKLGNYTSKTEYDYAGRPLKEYQADGSYTSTVYDKLGNAVSTTDFLGNTTSYQYDQLGRVLKATAPFDGTYTSEALTYYDNNGNIVMTKQQNNRPGEAVSYAVTANEYDSRNRLVSTRVNDGTRDIYTQYAYDNVGNMIKMVTGQTEKIADLFGALPKGVTYTTYEYDSRGNRISMENGGIISQYRYDTNNRLLSETSAAGTAEKKVNYSYDNNGNLIFKGTELYTDAAGTEQEEIGLNVSGSGITGSNIADAMAVYYTYNARGQLTNVQTDNGVNASYAYDATGRRSSQTVNGKVTTRAPAERRANVAALWEEEQPA